MLSQLFRETRAYSRFHLVVMDEPIGNYPIWHGLANIGPCDLTHAATLDGPIEAKWHGLADAESSHRDAHSALRSSP